MIELFKVIAGKSNGNETRSNICISWCLIDVSMNFGEIIFSQRIVPKMNGLPDK